ncbi:hypothetical protein [Mucilaginibacter sp. L3T2-6]|uniref:hypothetical protein n=1 Tax=Mucilaginibacter sp. L3T2-6 TaxID=3062491 RepID=UPI0026762CFF|nr:hypothetical protein [Mucilaginibacter sp. L3T2-6]MDO3641963.1 hypothetical protein [Mucilaginibacter sp. L3T2-6]MDV6214359.1 hypothetical protein [Mucilaginibacter sp. L3T2-6]
MKKLFLKIRGLLMQVADLKYVSWDLGQLEQEMPPVQYPCALFTIAYVKCSDTQDGDQRVKAVITIRIAFNTTMDRTSSNFSDHAADIALSCLDTVESVYSKLQSYWDDEVEQLSRVSQTQERRNDKLTVIAMPFETEFDEVAS